MSKPVTVFGRGLHADWIGRPANLSRAGAGRSAQTTQPYRHRTERLRQITHMHEELRDSGLVGNIGNE